VRKIIYIECAGNFKANTFLKIKTQQRNAIRKSPVSFHWRGFFYLARATNKAASAIYAEAYLAAAAAAFFSFSLAITASATLAGHAE